MFISRIARRYGRALFAAAQEREGVEGVLTELRQVEVRREERPELEEILRHPHIPVVRKQALLEEVFGEEVSALTLNFLQLLVRHRRTELLPQVIADLQQRYDAWRGLVRAQVTTAVPLTREEQEVLRQRLRELTGARKVVLEPEVDPAIIGGAIIRAAGRVIDGSVASYLEGMRERLKEVRV